MSSANQGVTNDRYTLVPRTLIFITREDRILLLRGAAKKRLWANLYNGIGGHIEQGENIRRSALREAYEETGLEIQSLQFCGTITVDVTEKSGVCIFVFKGEYAQGELRSSREGSLEWVPIEDVHQLPLVEDLYSLLPRVLAITPGVPPFFGHFSYDQDERLVITYEPLI